MSGTKITGKLTVLHAGSLDRAFGVVNKEYQRLYPDVELVDEGRNSTGLIREILRGKECGVMASADYSLIPLFMFPNIADWYLIFAANQMTLHYTDESRYHDLINSTNWPEIIQRDGVNFWHASAEQDPGGYRALMVMQLAEKYYRLPGLYQKLMSSENRAQMSRDPAVIQKKRAGYTFAYGAHLTELGFKPLFLPDEINLSKNKFADFYKQARVDIPGKTPGETFPLFGAPILFGLTVPKDYPNQEAAIAWVRLLFSAKGTEALKNSRMIPVIPAKASALGKIPEALKSLAATISVTP